jgi:glycosyltransferase involved in cell wall biosynthesis
VHLVPGDAPRVVVFIPVYHGVVNMLRDLLDSLDAYLGASCRVIVVDDHTTDGSAAQLEALLLERDGLTVLRNDVNQGWGFGIYKNFARAALHALREEPFDIFLKLDHDSLLIAPKVASSFAALLEGREIGLTGSVQPEINRWMFDWRVQPAIKREALRNGYLETLNGFVWSVQAGVMGFNRSCLEALAARGWLERFDFVRFGTAGLVEDVMLPILCSACGFRAVNAPFVLSRHGSEALLRTPYTALREVGVSVVHPIKQGLSGAGQHNASDHLELRGYFQRIRREERR